MQLRPYQERVLDELWQWFATHADGDPIVEACVGAGKSVLIAEMCRRAIEQHPGTRILMLVHSKELIEQNLHKLLAVWPNAPIGIYSASIGQRQLGRTITYATIGSIYKRAHELGHLDLVMVDECHLIGDSETTMYRRLIDGLRSLCPALRVIGWTGTPFRGETHTRSEVRTRRHGTSLSRTARRQSSRLEAVSYARRAYGCRGATWYITPPA